MVWIGQLLLQCLAIRTLCHPRKLSSQCSIFTKNQPRRWGSSKWFRSNADNASLRNTGWNVSPHPLATTYILIGSKLFFLVVIVTQSAVIRLLDKIIHRLDRNNNYKIKLSYRFRRLVTLNSRDTNKFRGCRNLPDGLGYQIHALLLYFAKHMEKCLSRLNSCTAFSRNNNVTHLSTAIRNLLDL